MRGDAFWTGRRWHTTRICSFVALFVFSPLYSKAQWSPNFDRTITDPHQIKAETELSSEIKLHPGVNDVTFFGVGTDSDGEDSYLAPTFISADRNVQISSKVKNTDGPVKDIGKIAVFGDHSAAGCPIDVFLPSASYNVERDWSLMPLGSFNTELSDWSSYSDDRSCGGTPIKTIEFYQGTLDGAPTTFMLIADRHDTIAQPGQASPYDIQVLVFSTCPVGRVSGPKGWLGAPAPYFGVFGRYTTSALYVNSDDALSSEFTLPTSKISKDN